MVVAQTKAMVFDVVGQQNRERGFDCFYALDEQWCIACGREEPKTYGKENVQTIHGSYTSPHGWLRIAVKIDEELKRRGIEPEEWPQWHKAYHGTAGGNVKSIIDKGLMVGDGRHGKAGAGGKSVIYCTPSVEYAAHFLYTKDNEIQIDGEKDDRPNREQERDGSSSHIACGWGEMIDALCAGGCHAQFVFEVRVRPASYRVQGNTLGGKLWPDFELREKRLPFDKFCPQRSLEWIVEDPKDIFITGVMIRQLNVTPKEYNEARIREMMEHVLWDEKTKAPGRPRDFGAARSGEPVAWEYNNSPKSSLSTSADMPWVRYSPETSAMIEVAYQEYQRFVFIGTPTGAPGPYCIDFMGMCDPSLKKDDGTLMMPLQRRADPDKEQAWRRRAVRRVRA